LDVEIEQLLTNDPGIKGVQQVPEFGSQTRASAARRVGGCAAFCANDARDRLGGRDSEIKQSGLWKGKAKLSKRGSGLLGRMLYMAALRSIPLQGSAFGAYYRRLVERGLKKGSALTAVMRKMFGGGRPLPQA